MKHLMLLTKVEISVPNFDILAEVSTNWNFWGWKCTPSSWLTPLQSVRLFFAIGTDASFMREQKCSIKGQAARLPRPVCFELNQRVTHCEFADPTLQPHRGSYLVVKRLFELKWTNRTLVIKVQLSKNSRMTKLTWSLHNLFLRLVKYLNAAAAFKSCRFAQIRVVRYFQLTSGVEQILIEKARLCEAARLLQRTASSALKYWCKSQLFNNIRHRWNKLKIPMKTTK